MGDELGVGGDQEAGDRPDDRQHHLHVDPEAGPGHRARAGGDDHTPPGHDDDDDDDNDDDIDDVSPLDADGDQGEHDDVAGEVLQHRQQVAHHLACTQCFGATFLHDQVAVYCTAGHEGSVGDVSCMSIFSACFGLLTSVQLAATTWSGQIWISC